MFMPRRRATLRALVSSLGVGLQPPMSMSMASRLLLLDHAANHFLFMAAGPSLSLSYLTNATRAHANHVTMALMAITMHAVEAL